MKAASVLGAGELGKACALALVADGCSTVRLLTRDVALAEPNGVNRGHCTGGTSASSADATTSSPWPSAIRLVDVRKTLHDAAAFSQCTDGPLFICTPISSYLSPDDAWARTAFRKEHSAITHDVLDGWRRSVPHSNSSLPVSSAVQVGSAMPFVCTFTRGFSADGGVPAQLAEELLSREAAASAGATVDAPGGAGKETPVLVAAGPLLAKEWAGQCTPITTHTDKATLSSSSSHFSSIPPRPQSWSSDKADAAGSNKKMNPTENNTTTTAPSIFSYPHTFSGVSLSFAAWTPSLHADTGRQDALAEQLQRMFPRESVTYLREADAAAVLSIVNGCVPLCAFGAGLVSSVYTGASVTALASYAQHAMVATEHLVNALLGRKGGTPLPVAACSTLIGACTSLSSREFALGRQFDFYFRKQDALQAIFRGCTHQVFAATVDGLNSRMRSGSVTNPFYEVLMDTFNTLIRATRAGEGLVKEGYYGYRDIKNDESVLLRHVISVDEAMLAGDEAQFTAAKERLVKAFPGAVVH